MGSTDFSSAPTRAPSCSWTGTRSACTTQATPAPASDTRASRVTTWSRWRSRRTPVTLSSTSTSTGSVEGGPVTDDRVTLTQDEGARLALDHGAVALQGAQGPALKHEVAMVHATPPGAPLVHMVCWDEEPCDVELRGRVELVGDPDAPLVVRMGHEFLSDHHQTHVVEPVDHTLHVDTALAAPIHHALQMRTPLELRFCNPWHVTSDYRMEITLGDSRVIGVRLTGATVATPQPCG